MICLKKLIQEALHPIHRSVRGRLAYVTSAAFSEPVGEPSLQSLLGANAPQAEVGHDSSRRDAIGLLALLVEKILHGVRECDNHTSGLSEIPLRCCWMTRLHKHWALGRATLLHKKSLQHYCTKKSFQHPFAEILGTPAIRSGHPNHMYDVCVMAKAGNMTSSIKGVVGCGGVGGRDAGWGEWGVG